MCKKLIGIVMALALVFGALTLTADAKGCKKGKGFEEKVSCKAHFLLKNKEELELTDAQVDKIKELKLNSKKDTIEKTAEIDILALDIKAGLYGDTVDSAQLGALIDKKYKIKAEKAKATVGAYAALKGVLTEAQKEKMKELYKKCKPSR